MRALWLIGVVLFCCIGGCQKPLEVIEEARKSADSWRATLQMTLQQWIDDRVPARYVKQIFEAAQKELGKELPDVEKLPAGEEGREKVLKQTKELQEWVGKNLAKIGDADHKQRQAMLGSLP
jgi:hypothetical protein